MSENNTPNPGSNEAVNKGCTCPIMDNARGRGYMGIPGQFVMSAGCPLHGVNTNEQNSIPD